MTWILDEISLSFDYFGFILDGHQAKHQDDSYQMKESVQTEIHVKFNNSTQLYWHSSTYTV